MQLFLCGGAKTPINTLYKHFQSKYINTSYFDFLEGQIDNILKAAPDCLLIASTINRFDIDIDSIKLLRTHSWEVPLIHLIEEANYILCVRSLNAGSDDAIQFTCAYEEVDARVNAVVRRMKPNTLNFTSNIVKYPHLELNLDSREIVRDGITTKLTIKELELLLLFLRNSNKVLSRSAILQSVWGNTWHGSDNLLDVYIGYLRKKLHREGLPKLLHTIRNAGYMIK